MMPLLATYSVSTPGPKHCLFVSSSDQDQLKKKKWKKMSSNQKMMEEYKRKKEEREQKREVGKIGPVYCVIVVR